MDRASTSNAAAFLNRADLGSLLDDYHYTDPTKSRWHSDALKTTERLHRVGNTLQYRITIDDPKIFERPWSQDYVLTLRPDWEQLGLIECTCEANNQCAGGDCSKDSPP